MGSPVVAATSYRWRFRRLAMLAATHIGNGMVLRHEWNGVLVLFLGAPMNAGT